jgi:hypothetical protein
MTTVPWGATAHRVRSVYHRATCIGMHVRFCKTGAVREPAIFANLLADAAPV